MNPNEAKIYKATQVSKRSCWRVSINGKGASFIPGRDMSYQEAFIYMGGRFPGYKIGVGA